MDEKDFQPIQHPEAVEPGAVVAAVESIEVVESIEIVASVEVVESVEPAEPAEDAEDVEDVEPLAAADSVEPAPLAPEQPAEAEVQVAAPASELEGKSVLILGLGESGLAMARWCAREGARVRVADTRAVPPGQAALAAELPDVALHCGAFAAELLDGIDLVGISPGLAPAQEPQASLLAAARAQGIAVWGELEFFARKLAALAAQQKYRPRVLAITGTNGKTTVTSLTGKLCRRAGLSTVVAGNISPSLLAALTAALDAQGEAQALPQAWVLELSSFQLALPGSFAPDAATVLNLSEDHLDWHTGMDDYAAAKARIFAPGTVRVLNRNDARVWSMGDANGHARVIGFGTDAPDLDADESFGIVQDGGIRWLAFSEVPESEEKKPARGRQKSLANVAREPAFLRRLMPVDALHIRGDHNAANALAALALCRAIGLPTAPLLHGLREYRGEPHRVELVANIEGVDYVDDSKGTNVGATAAALEGLGSQAQSRAARIVLIAGGEGKGQDFGPLALPVAAHARAVLLIGRDAPLVRAALVESGVPLTDCASLEEAVRAAAEAARPGDTVLLSPACASFDMFRNYAHRAEVFAAAVHELAAEVGQPC